MGVQILQIFHLDLFREKPSRLGCYNILKRKTGFQHIFISLHLLGKVVIIQYVEKPELISPRLVKKYDNYGN